MSSPARRARENATGIVSTVVTGVWLAALFLDYEWWLPFMLFGYVVLVPVTAMLFGDEEEVTEWWDGEADTVENEETNEEDDPLEELRARYARGELTDEQFERKLDRLLETETLEDVEDERRREREPERE
ncbi:MAG: SHOCT domain-containing protein [Halobacteriales archaeon]